MNEPKRERILVVDDEPDMLKLLEVIIAEKAGYPVVTTTKPLEVGRLLASDDFDLVLTDLRMPGKDGLEIMAENSRGEAAIPVIIITAYGTIESAVEAIRKGAFDYITKPFRKEHVLLTIERAMKYRRLQKENLALRQELSRLRQLLPSLPAA